MPLRSLARVAGSWASIKSDKKRDLLMGLFHEDQIIYWPHCRITKNVRNDSNVLIYNVCMKALENKEIRIDEY